MVNPHLEEANYLGFEPVGRKPLGRPDGIVVGGGNRIIVLIATLVRPPVAAADLLRDLRGLDAHAHARGQAALLPTELGSGIEHAVFSVIAVFGAPLVIHLADAGFHGGIDGLARAVAGDALAEAPGDARITVRPAVAAAHGLVVHRTPFGHGGAAAEVDSNFRIAIPPRQLAVFPGGARRYEIGRSRVPDRALSRVGDRRTERAAPDEALGSIEEGYGRTSRPVGVVWLHKFFWIGREKVGAAECIVIIIEEARSPNGDILALDPEARFANLDGRRPPKPAFPVDAPHPPSGPDGNAVADDEGAASHEDDILAMLRTGKDAV